MRLSRIKADKKYNVRDTLEDVLDISYDDNIGEFILSNYKYKFNKDTKERIMDFKNNEDYNLDLYDLDNSILYLPEDLKLTDNEVKRIEDVVYNIASEFELLDYEEAAL